MDVRLPATAGDRPRLPWLVLVIGAVLLVAAIAALGTQALDRVDGIDALMLALTGVVIMGWGGYRLSSRPLLHHDTGLHLDGVGITVQSTDAGAMLLWSDVELVEVAWWEIVPPYVDGAQHLPVLRFVARDDRDISRNGPGVLAARLGQAFGMSPSAAALTVVVGPAGVEALQQAIDWIEDNRGEVPIEIGEPPAAPR
jgi:hypothetical protein